MGGKRESGTKLLKFSKQQVNQFSKNFKNFDASTPSLLSTPLIETQSKLLPRHVQALLPENQLTLSSVSNYRFQ